jgi:hypothetical protein
MAAKWRPRDDGHARQAMALAEQVILVLEAADINRRKEQDAAEDSLGMKPKDTKRKKRRKVSRAVISALDRILMAIETGGEVVVLVVKGSK